MDTLHPKQIPDLNLFFEQNPFNTGPRVSPRAFAHLPLLEIAKGPRMQSKLEIPTPELSSSPTSTAPSSPYSSRSTLSLDDPEIRKIWDDPRFGPVVHEGISLELSSTLAASLALFGEGEDTLLDAPTFLKDGFGAGALNPLAQPFVPCFVSRDTQHPINMDHISTFYDENSLLSPLNLTDGRCGLLNPTSYLRTIEETTTYPAHMMSYFPAAVKYSVYPPYTQGLPHPPQNTGQFGSQEAEPCREALPAAYLSILIEALLPIHDNSGREVRLQTVFNLIQQWDLFTLRELASTLIVAAFGDELDLVLPCSKKGCPNHEYESIDIEESIARHTVTLPEEIFYQVIAGFTKIFLRNSGQFFVDTFLVQLVQSIFSRFIFYFNPNNPDSLNTFYKTHKTPPCLSYIRSAFFLCKTIAFLFQQNVVQQVNVSQCIMLLFQDIMFVEHIEALSLIVLGSGLKLWDPPLSLLSTPSVLVDGVECVPASPSKSSPPSNKQQAKAMLRSDINMFCSKLDGYKIERGGNGSSSLRGHNWNWSGETYRSRIKEVTDTVREWEKQLIVLIDEREEPVSTSQNQEDD